MQVRLNVFPMPPETLKHLKWEEESTIAAKYTMNNFIFFIVEKENRGFFLAFRKEKFVITQHVLSAFQSKIL